MDRSAPESNGGQGGCLCGEECLRLLPLPLMLLLLLRAELVVKSPLKLDMAWSNRKKEKILKEIY